MARHNSNPGRRDSYEDHRGAVDQNYGDRDVRSPGDDRFYGGEVNRGSYGRGHGHEGSAREPQQWGGGGQRDWEDAARERGYASPWQGGPQGGGRGYESGAGYRQEGPGYGGTGYGGRYAGSGYGADFSGSGYGSEFGGQGGWGGAYGAPDLAPGQQRGSAQAQQQHQPHQHFDPDYHQWRTEQMNKLDEDYRSWRSQRYQKFSDEFNTWRSQRQSNADAETGAAGGTSTASDATSTRSGQGKSK